MVTVTAENDPVMVRTDRRLVGLVLNETIENAFEHNDSDTPKVEIAVQEREWDARVKIGDNGPGISGEGRSVLLEGEETPFQHDSVIGLWLVYWGITRLDGDLEFEENELRGSIVSISIPDQ